MNKRLVAAGALVLGVAGIALLGGGVVVKGRVLQRITDELTASVDARVSIGRAEASLWTSFPALGVHLSEVAVDNTGAFEGERLLEAAEVSVYVDLFSAFGSELSVERFAMRDAAVHVIADAEGRMNTDIFGPSEDSGGSTSLRLDGIDLDGVSFRYEDRAGGTDVRLTGLDHRSSGAIRDEVARLSTETTIESLTAEAGGVAWLSEVHTALMGDVAYDLGTGGLTLSATKLTLNELVLALDGGFVPAGADYDVDLTYKTADTDFKTLWSVLPAAYTADYADVDASGSFALDGFARGRYASEGDDLPEFAFTLDVPDARVKYPDLPAPVEAISAHVAVAHPQGPTDATTVEVDRFAFTVDGQTLKGRLGLANPTTDPRIDLEARGRLDLGALSRAYPMPGTQYAGGMDIDIALAGTQSAFETTRVGDITARGSGTASQMVYTSADVADPVYIDKLVFRLTPRHAELTELAVRTGSTDVKGTGFLEHPVAYALGRGALSGQLSLRGKRLDLDELSAGGDTETTADDGALVTVPTDLDLMVGCRFDALKAQGVETRNMVGELIVKDGAVTLRNVQVEVLGGRVALDGRYAAPTPEGADMDVRIAGIDLDLVRTLDTFPSVSRMLPAAVGATGRFDTGMEIGARLGPDGGLVIDSVRSDGKILSRGMKVVPGPLAKLGEKLGNTAFGRLDLDGSSWFYTLLDGNLSVEPTALKVGTAPGTLGGKVGVLAQTLDLALDFEVPTQSLAGTSLLGGRSLPVGKTTPVKVRLTGDWDDPKLSADLGSTVAAVAEAVVTEAVGEATSAALSQAIARGDALIAEAEKQAEEVRRTARKAAAGVRAEAKRAGDALIAEATNPLTKKAAEKSAEKLAVEADKKATRIESEADAKATGLVDGARAKKAELVKAAGG